MHCGSCPLLIDDTLEDLPGVSRSHTELKAARSTVWLDTTHTDPQRVVETITGLGYTASVLS
jgi:copper chaperone CopZ